VVVVVVVVAVVVVVVVAVVVVVVVVVEVVVVMVAVVVVVVVKEEKKDTPAVQGNSHSLLHELYKTLAANSTCCTPAPLPLFCKGLNITQFANFFSCEFGRTAEQLGQ